MGSGGRWRRTVNECNEALDAAREALAVARRLATVVDNAILNGDLNRARAALQNLQACHTGMRDEIEVHSAHGSTSQDR
jgi:endonuclease/exonuclease/phosphatase (EEP) superfamily protein YafD